MSRLIPVATAKCTIVGFEEILIKSVMFGTAEK